jgi:IS5 family transposase
VVQNAGKEAVKWQQTVKRRKPNMLRDGYAPTNVFRYVPQLSLEMEPVLAQLDHLLEDDRLFETVKADLSQRRPGTLKTGRNSTPVEVVLRMLVVKHLYGWSYEATEQWVSDSLVLRQFCRVYFNTVPDDTVLIRWANLIQPETLHELLAHVVQMARELKVTRGRQLRTDGTVVETNIHYPVDSTLLADGVRVLSRVVQRAQPWLDETAREVVSQARQWAQQARHTVKHIADAARRRGEQAEQALHTHYQTLVDLTETVITHAQHVTDALHTQSEPAAQRLVNTALTFLPRVQQVLDQTVRRVLEKQSVPAADKLVSLFEPQTAILRRGKPGKATEFGRVVWLDEVEGGLITRYDVLPGAPADDQQLLPALDHHQQLFDQPPRLVAGDRGVHSPSNETEAIARGVKFVVLPKPGAKTEDRQRHEQQRWFRYGRNWRAGIEGRISGLKRRHRLDRCRYHGEDGMERWVGWGVIAHDLRMIAQVRAR